MDKQVVSKQRVADHGEVLTGRREVNAMLDYLQEPALRTGDYRIDLPAFAPVRVLLPAPP